MALRRLVQQNHNANLAGFGAGPAGGEQAPLVDNRRIQHLANTVGTLPRGRKVWGGPGGWRLRSAPRAACRPPSPARVGAAVPHGAAWRLLLGCWKG